MKLPEITAKMFFAIGKYAFFTNAVIGLIRVVDLWDVLKSYDIFSSLAMTIFYFVLAGYFANMQKQEDIRTVNDGDIIKMSEALDKLELEETNAKKR